MAESRIVKYDDINKTVHWFYHRHEDDKRIDVIEPVTSFINNVVLHCPERNFKMIRYFGFYANKSSKTYDRMAELVGKNLNVKFSTKKKEQQQLK
ncbi:MAG: transposase [Thomasclavelia sp.]